MLKSVLAASILALAPICAQAADITVPPGFRATLVFEGAGPARHMAFDARGDLYVSKNPANGKSDGILALRDADGDGRFDEARRFGDVGGTGIRFHGGDLYATSSTAVYRYRFKEGELVPSAAPDTILSGMPATGFASRPIAFDDKGGLYVGIGGGGNTCVDRSGPAPKPANPCTELLTRGGVWRYDANRTGQTHPAAGLRFATGVRDIQALAFDPADRSLYAVVQGRTGADAGKIFSAEDAAQGVAEEMHRIVRGSNLGWPYTLYDGRVMRRVGAPEYGGKPGVMVTDSAYATPLAVFPPHSSPLDLVFYEGKAFPAAYRGGAFVAFRGGSEPNGYNVWFVSRPGARGAKPVVFADGFAGANRKQATADARPTGLAVSPKGALYVMDGNKGRIWRIDYVGKTGR
jgi:glucose/arabinose dehydrogenase